MFWCWQEDNNFSFYRQSRHWIVCSMRNWWRLVVGRFYNPRWTHGSDDYKNTFLKMSVPAIDFHGVLHLYTRVWWTQQCDTKSDGSGVPREGIAREGWMRCIFNVMKSIKLAVRSAVHVWKMVHAILRAFYVTSFRAFFSIFQAIYKQDMYFLTNKEDSRQSILAQEIENPFPRIRFSCVICTFNAG
jgi:hypothetical protein